MKTKIVDTYLLISETEDDEDRWVDVVGTVERCEDWYWSVDIKSVRWNGIKMPYSAAQGEYLEDCLVGTYKHLAEELAKRTSVEP